MDLARQVADAKAAVREARERIARDLQAAQSSLEYEVTHLQGEHMDRLQAQIQTRELSDAWDAWAGVPKRRAQHQRILDKALERRRARALEAKFGDWHHAQWKRARGRARSLREEVRERERQLARIEGKPAAAEGKQAEGISSRLARQSDAAMGQHTARLESQLRRAERETADAEDRQAEAVRALRERRAALGSAQESSVVVESELREQQAELEESMSQASGDVSLASDDSAVTELQSLVQQLDVRIADAVQTRSQAEQEKHDGEEELEDELARETQLRESANLQYDELERRLSEHETELEGTRAAISAAQRAGDESPDANLRSALEKERERCEAAEEQLRAQEEALGEKERELEEASVASEAAIDELRHSTAELKASMSDQLMQASGAAKAIELRTDAVRRKVAAQEEDLAHALDATNHAEQELVVQSDAHRLRLQSEQQRVEGMRKHYDALTREGEELRAALSGKRGAASKLRDGAGNAHDRLTAQLAEEDTAIQQSATESDGLDERIRLQQAELEETVAELRDVQTSIHSQRASIMDSLNEKLMEETMKGQGAKLIHDSALRTFATVEDRLNSAKQDGEKMHQKADEQRMRLAKLVREAQASRTQAEQEHHAAGLKQAEMKAEMQRVRGAIEALDRSVREKKELLGDTQRSAASAGKVDEARIRELTSHCTARDSEVAAAREELAACVNATREVRDKEGSRVREAAMRRRIAEQEVQLLRQQLESLVSTTSSLRSQCIVAETEARKLQVKIARMRARSPTPRSSEKLDASISLTSFSASQGLEFSFGDSGLHHAARSPATWSSRSRSPSPARSGKTSPEVSPIKDEHSIGSGALMDIDALIQQVAAEHTKASSLRQRPEPADVKVRETPRPQPEPEPEPAPAFDATEADSMMMMSGSPRGPVGARNLFAPTGVAGEKVKITVAEPSQRLDEPEEAVSDGARPTAAESQRSSKGPPPLPGRLHRQPTADALADIDQMLSSATDSVKADVPSRPAPSAAIAPARPSPSFSAAIASREPKTATTIASRQPKTATAIVPVRPPPMAAAIPPRVGPIRGPIAPRTGPPKRSIAPRPPPAWSRMLEIAPDAVAATASLLRPPPPPGLECSELVNKPELDPAHAQEQQDAAELSQQLRRARKKFDQLDADGNGFLSGEEIHNLALWVFGSFNPGEKALPKAIREAEANKLMGRLDANADGKIDFDEFEGWFTRTCASIQKFRRAQARKAEQPKRPRARRRRQTDAERRHRQATAEALADIDQMISSATEQVAAASVAPHRPEPAPVSPPPSRAHRQPTTEALADIDQLIQSATESAAATATRPESEAARWSPGACVDLEVSEDEDSGFGMDVDAGGLVTGIHPGGGAARAGLPVGSTIVGVHGVTVRGRQEMATELSKCWEDPWAEFTIQLPVRRPRHLAASLLISPPHH